MGKKSREIKQKSDMRQAIAAFLEDIGPKKGFCLVFLFVGLVLIFKLVLSYYAYGTNDITYWRGFSDVIAQQGTFKIYSLVKIYNHPPLMSWILKIIRYVALESSLSFQFIFRLMPITADFLSIFVIWKLLSAWKVKTRTLLCILCSVNPINFLISGFHGNTDPVFIFFILIAIYFAENNKPKFSGLFYGLSLCIKIVPVILLPVFIFYLKGKKVKIRFILCSLIFPCIVFLPYLALNFRPVLRSIFSYGSIPGIWGIGHILKSVFVNDNINMAIRMLAHIIFEYHIISFRFVFFICLAALIWRLKANKKINLIEWSFLSFCLFLVITPGFGVQYLSWLSYFAILVMPSLAMPYLFIGAFFLYRVYSYWGGGVFPYYANSLKAGQWVGFEQALDILLWIIVVSMLIRFLYLKILSTPRQLS